MLQIAFSIQATSNTEWFFSRMHRIEKVFTTSIVSIYVVIWYYIVLNYNRIEIALSGLAVVVFQ